MDFPQVKGDPLDEYSDLKLFAGAFPWLFPGGIGDWVDNYTNESTRIDICLERLIRYEDGRFERDRMFPWIFSFLYIISCQTCKWICCVANFQKLSTIMFIFIKMSCKNIGCFLVNFKLFFLR